METKRLWLTRMALGGLCAVGAALLLLLCLNFVVNSIVWAWGGTPDYTDIQLTFDRCAAYFGSAALAVTVELLAVFALGAAIGLATLPFAETWTSLLGLSILHFFITGVLAQIVGWAYRWFGFAPDEGAWTILAVYAGIYALIWVGRWLLWYSELRKLRKALGLNKEG